MSEETKFENKMMNWVANLGLKVEDHCHTSLNITMML